MCAGLQLVLFFLLSLDQTFCWTRKSATSSAVACYLRTKILHISCRTSVLPTAVSLKLCIPHCCHSATSSCPMLPPLHVTCFPFREPHSIVLEEVLSWSSPACAMRRLLKGHIIPVQNVQRCETTRNISYYTIQRYSCATFRRIV